MKTPEEHADEIVSGYASAAGYHATRMRIVSAIREAIAEMKEECAVTCDDAARGTNFEMAKYGANLSPKRIRALGETKATTLGDFELKNEEPSLEARVRELEEQTRVLIRTSTARLAALESWRDQVKK